MLNEWERMSILLALWLGWWWASNQNCLCLFSELAPWRSIHQPPFTQFPQDDDGGFCLWKMLSAKSLNICFLAGIAAFTAFTASRWTVAGLAYWLWGRLSPDLKRIQIHREQLTEPPPTKYLNSWLPCVISKESSWEWGKNWWKHLEKQPFS